MDKFLVLLLSTFLCLNASSQGLVRVDNVVKTSRDIKTGAQRTELYLSELKGKSVGLIGNQTSMVGQTHLLDTLLALGIKVKKVFGPEHGFRGTADAGDQVKTMKDKRTGLPV